MTEVHYKHVVYHEIAGVAAALGEPHRIEILELLCQCERNVEVLAAMLELGVTTVSHHLQVLKRARLVDHAKTGRRVYYSATPMAVSLWTTISRVAAAELAEVRYASEELFNQNTETEPVGYSELLRRIESGEAVLIDVRPEEEYAAGHVPGAVSLPLERLRENTASIPHGKPVFAYCRGRYCVLSHEAVQILNQQGYTAVRVPEGVAEWKAAGAALPSNQRSTTL